MMDDSVLRDYSYNELHGEIITKAVSYTHLTLPTILRV